MMRKKVHVVFNPLPAHWALAPAVASDGVCEARVLFEGTNPDRPIRSNAPVDLTELHQFGEAP